MTPANAGAGRDKPLCGAQRKRGQGPCTRPAGWGTSHVGIGACKLHGGCTPNHEIAARKELAADAVATFGLPRDIEPHEALLEELHATAGHVAWLRQLIAAGEHDDTGPSVLKQRDTGKEGTVWERPSVWVELYHRERRHYLDVAATCVKVGLEEKRIAIAERMGEQLAQVIRLAALDLFARARELGLDAGVLEQLERQEYPQIVRRRLLAIEGDSEAA